MCVSLFTTTNRLLSHNRKKTMFLSRKLANMRSTKALRDFAAVNESQPTPATLVLTFVHSLKFDNWCHGGAQHDLMLTY